MDQDWIENRILFKAKKNGLLKDGSKCFEQEKINNTQQNTLS